MPGKSSQNVVQQLEEVKKKLNLLDGDRKAYYESSQWVIKDNRQKISNLRKEVKDLRVLKAKRLAADEVVVNKGLEHNEKERHALRDKPGSVAVQRMDEKVCDAQKKLDLEKYKTSKKMAQLEELQTQYNQIQKDAAEAVATDAGESAEAENLRNLENRLDKAELKCKEAEHIHKTYLQIKKKLMDEQMTFDGNLDALQSEILKAKQELKELQAMNNDAQIARDTAKSELEKQERQVYEERKKREMELAEVRKEAEEKRLQHERIERRIKLPVARGSLTQDELTPAEKQALTGEDEQQKITTYEEAMKYMKEATGVSDTKEVVVRFETQGDTQKHLEELKREGEKQIARLKEEKEKLQNEFEEMKYSGEMKLSRKESRNRIIYLPYTVGQRKLEEFQNHLDEESGRRDEAEEQLEGSTKILLKVRSGIEHLSEKLKHLKAPSSQVQKAKISPTSDEHVLDQLSQCDVKLLKVLEELDGKELDDVVKEMEDEDFQAENKPPPYNTRVKFPTSQKDMIYDDDEDSGEDEGDIMTRNTIKRQAQQVLEQRNRRKVTKRKKPKK